MIKIQNHTLSDLDSFTQVENMLWNNGVCRCTAVKDGKRIDLRVLPAFMLGKNLYELFLLTSMSFLHLYSPDSKNSIRNMRLVEYASFIEDLDKKQKGYLTWYINYLIKLSRTNDSISINVQNQVQTYCHNFAAKYDITLISIFGSPEYVEMSSDNELPHVFW